MPAPTHAQDLRSDAAKLAAAGMADEAARFTEVAERLERESLPEWMRADFSVRRYPFGYLVMDGETPVSDHPFETAAPANRVARDCQRRRDVLRARTLRGDVA
jgi:hypothetical protein